ncbi:MAG: hypothetical protein ABEH64_08230, partial [Salinirussus sp.]
YYRNPRVDGVDVGPFPTACFRAGTAYNVAFAWWLPVDHGNELQTDTATFSLGLYTEQCRHNDGSGMAPEYLIELTGDSPQGQGAGFAQPWDTTNRIAHRGAGAWGTVDHGQDGEDDATDTDGDGRLEYKQGFYFGADFSDFDVLPEFTVSEIQEISYWLFELDDLNGVDIYLTIYTRPEGDGDDAASWYDSRLQALPAQSNGGSPNFTPLEWNQFSTASNAPNELNFSDTGRGGNHVQPLPTMADIQSGPVDWSSYGANLSLTNDYRDETVRALSLQTGSESGVDLVAAIDDVEVRLTDGSRLVLDLEP